MTPQLDLRGPTPKGGEGRGGEGEGEGMGQNVHYDFQTILGPELYYSRKLLVYDAERLASFTAI